MSNVFDVGIVGLGVAGAFATLKLAKDHKNLKVIGFDIGRPPAKRKRQIEGWLGCLTTSDGKLYLNDLNKITEITGLRRVKSAHKWFNKTISNINDFKIVKDRSPNVSVEKRLKKIGYDIRLNNFVQMYPKDIHTLSKQMADTIEQNKNITFKFDNEVVSITKQKNTFLIKTEEQEYKCKKLIVAAGRSGWRWVSKLFTNFGIVDNNDIARFGIRVETTSLNMKEFNKSNCTITKNDVELGPFSWFGMMIPEDHLDVAISAFRSNETRWHTDKVSFNLIGKRSFPNNGWEQTDRLGKLAFILSNDRIIKEKVSTILSEKSVISALDEYDWLKEVITELATAIPEIATKAYFYIPTIIPSAPQIILGNNLESEVPGMYVVGESAGLHGILAAAVSGIIAADAICK